MVSILSLSIKHSIGIAGFVDTRDELCSLVKERRE